MKKFVLSTTAKAVKESNNPYIGLLLAVSVIVIIVLCAALILRNKNRN